MSWKEGLRDAWTLGANTGYLGLQTETKVIHLFYESYPLGFQLFDIPKIWPQLDTIWLTDFPHLWINQFLLLSNGEVGWYLLHQHKQDSVLKRRKSDSNVAEYPWGFIILRCVHDSASDRLWRWSYEAIRRLYSSYPIVVIDDHSSAGIENQPEDVLTLLSDWPPGRAELLPYWIMWKYKPFKRAIFLHDSMFLQNRLSEEVLCGIDGIRFLWHFSIAEYDQPEEEQKWIRHLIKHDPSLLSQTLERHRDRSKWKGCFGLSCCFTYDWIASQVRKFHILERLMPLLKNRRGRMALERVWGVLWWQPEIGSCFGEITDQWYPQFKGEGAGFQVTARTQFIPEMYEFYCYMQSLPIIKVFQSR